MENKNCDRCGGEGTDPKVKRSVDGQIKNNFGVTTGVQVTPFMPGNECTKCKGTGKIEADKNT